MSIAEPDVLELARAERDRRNVASERASLAITFRDFVRAAWPVLKPQEPYKHGWHIDAICAHLEAVSAGEIDRLQVWIPPGTMKSGTVTVFWHPWEWTTRPWLRYWGASYETRLAGRLSAMSRDLIMSDWYQTRWPIEFNREGEFYYANTEGGTRLATAPNSTGTGEHGHRILIDDPINAKAADATSRVVLEGANEWYDGTVATRGIGHHARVIVMQRLHENDLAGHAQEIEDWTVLCLPERFEVGHPYAWRGERVIDPVAERLKGTPLEYGDPRDENELIWPQHRNDQQSEALAKALTSYRAAGQLQQRPAAREGQIIKTAWWRFYDPRIRSQERWTDLPRMGMVIISTDTPLKDKQTSDKCSMQCYGVRGADRYLLDIRTDHMSYPIAKRTLLEMARWARRTWPYCPHYILIENMGYGVELIVDIKRELTGVEKIDPAKEGDKEVRAESATDALSSGNIFVPGIGPPEHPAYDETRTPADVAAFLFSCAQFPFGTFDDDVDAWSQAQNWLRRRTVTPMRTSSSMRKRR